MKRTALALAGLVVSGACSTAESNKDPQPKADRPAAPATPTPAPAAPAAPPASHVAPTALPPAGKAPRAVSVTKELDPMWTAAIKTLNGEPTTLATFKGKALLLVNVASQCGFTPQYAALEALYEKYGPRGFAVIGFPCNQFGAQEPGSAQEIQSFCRANYGVTFPIMQKIEVNGPGQHAIYKALTPIKDAAGKNGDISWNFEKFVVSADGKAITRFAPETTPDDPAVIAAIENALPKK